MLRRLQRAATRVATHPTPLVRAGHRLVGLALERTNWTARAQLAWGDSLYVDLSNSVGRTIWLRGEYLAERAIVDRLHAVLKAGDVFVDIGANVGFYTVLASRLVDPGVVYAFEPFPRVAALLRKNVRVNNLANVVVLEAAVSRTSGSAELVETRDSAYAFLLPPASRRQAVRSVQAITLDAHTANIGAPIRLIKIDIQGSEVDALDGGERTLSADAAPDVICEVSSWHLAKYGHTPEEIFARFEAWGYRATDPGTGNPMTVADITPRNENVFFQRPR